MNRIHPNREGEENADRVGEENADRVGEESAEPRFSRIASCLRISLCVLVGLLLVVAVIFLSLFLVYYVKYKRQDRNAACNTPSCIIAAASVAEKMDTSADPCEDFVQYACGNFYRTTTFKEGRTRINSFTIVNDVNQEVKKAILSDENAGEKWNYTKNMRNYYAACMDEEKIEELGVQQFLNSEFAQQWPTLKGENWPEGATFDLNDLIAQFQLVHIQRLFSGTVLTSLTNSSEYMLHLYDPGLNINRKYLLGARNNSILQAYEKYLVDVAVELGANRTVAQTDVTDVVDLEVELVKIMVPRKERRNVAKRINPTTVAELGRKYPYVDIPRALRAAFSTVNIKLDDLQVVNVDFPTYFDKLGGVIAAAKNRTIQNLFGLSHATKRVSKLTKRLREIKLEFDKIYRGRKEEAPRWEKCQFEASVMFSKGVGKEYVRRKFSEKSKTYMDVMIGHLKGSFKRILEKASWMEKSTKTKAYEKLAAMGRKIGYPDVGFENEDVEERYKELVMTVDNYYENRVVYNLYYHRRRLRRLEQTVDKNEWITDAFDANAYYSPQVNEIVFPAGVLQPPFFSDQFPDSLNYGAIGVIIGHEITHGFDDLGSQFDKNGNAANWWHPGDLDKFKERGQCLVDQYGAYRVESVGMNLNSINTEGENIADNGGLKESYMAYRKLVSEKGHGKRLPGLGLSHDQLFFLGYAQVWCEKMVKKRLIKIIETGSHTIGQYRIIGPLQNSKGFSKAYNCAKGTYMNPEKKCSVW